MTYEQIDRLLNAGFTPDQIMQLSSAPADSAVTHPADSAGDDQPEPTEPAQAENSTRLRNHLLLLLLLLLLLRSRAYWRKSKAVLMI